MSQLIQISQKCLEKVAAYLSKTPWEKEIEAKVNQMRAELQTPCLVAVCGESRAGKSTFVNAFIGADLAKTGVTETTSTLTFFKYGSKKENGKVVCHWANGKKSNEKIEFVHALQGHDETVMQKAATISHIEIYLHTPHLMGLTLADNPGNGSLIPTHERNAKRLVQNDAQESAALSRKADGVIYLISNVGKLSDSEFIKEYKEIGRSVLNPMNIIGVMTKVDRSSNILKHRWHFAKDLLDGIPELNTVIPVSALLEKTIKSLEPEGKLKILQQWLHRIPKETCDELLDEREFFDEDDSFDDCPYSTIERRKKRGGLQWTVFQLIARTLISHNHGKALPILREYAGFDHLRHVLKTHFIERSQILKCNRIISQIHHELMQIWHYKIYIKQKEMMTRKAKVRKFNILMESLEGKHKMPQELVDLVKNSKIYDFEFKAVQNKLSDALKAVESVLEELSTCNNDFSALQLLKDHRDSFSQSDFQELTQLFGQYHTDSTERLNPLPSSDPITITQRQLYWQAEEKISRPARRMVAEQAINRYSRLLAAAYKEGNYGSQAPPAQVSVAAQ